MHADYWLIIGGYLDEKFVTIYAEVRAHRKLKSE
jgi:hypothetical protein